MHTSPIRLGASAFAVAIAGASSLHGATYVGSAYEGFDYGTAANVPQPTPPPAAPTGGLSGGTGWGSGTGAQWGVTYGADNTTLISGSNARFALNGNTTTVASTNQQILGTGLSYSGLVNSGGALQVSGIASPNTSASVGRHFGQVVDAGTFYFSYLVQKNSDTVRTTNVSFFGVTSGATAPLERVSVGQFGNSITYLNATGNNYNAGPATVTVPTGTNEANQGDIQVGLFNVNALGSVYNNTSGKGNGIFQRNATTNPNNIAAQPLTLNDTYMVVGKFEFDISGVNDRLTLYLNPTSLTDESSNLAYFTVTDVDFGQLTGFRVFSGNQFSGAINGNPSTTFIPASATYDEFRFGTSFGDVVVVPEPAAAVLGSFGLLGLFIRRRRA